MPVRAARLKHRVQLQSYSATQDPFSGQEIGAWGTDATVWGAVEPISGTERYRAEQVNPELTHRVIVRYGSHITVTPEKRFKFGSRILEIVDVVNPVYGNEYLECMCRESVAT